MDKRALLLHDGDLVIGTDRQLTFISGEAEIAQALERAFTTNAGEWFLNDNHGFEYYKIQDKHGLLDEHVQMAVLRCALQEGRVREVIDIQIQRDITTRTIDIQFICTVDSGETITVPFAFETGNKD